MKQCNAIKENRLEDVQLFGLKADVLMLCSAILAHCWLNEKLNIFGILGCILCIVGSMTIVLHAPEEREISSLLEVWQLALQPGECWLDQLAQAEQNSLLACFPWVSTLATAGQYSWYARLSFTETAT